jgi:hypothetical protein
MYTEHHDQVTAFNLRSSYDSPRPHRDGRWLQRHQQPVMAYRQEANRVLKAQLGGRWRCLTDTEHRRVQMAEEKPPWGYRRIQGALSYQSPRCLARAKRGFGSFRERAVIDASVVQTRWRKQWRAQLNTLTPW